MNKAIGGYFELELNSGREFHANAIRLNTGRNCLEYILIAKKYTKLYIPFYSCDVLIDTIKNLGVAYTYYNIDKDLNPIFNNSQLKKEDALLYINYYGIKQKTVESLATKYENLIIDNSQAFFCKPIKGVDTFYSARKFFGVPDGAYLYTDVLLNMSLPKANSNDRVLHLLLRIEKGAEIGYPAFCQNENKLKNKPLETMSQLTELLLKNINYNTVLKKRNLNFLLFHSSLAKINQLNIDINSICAPMVYPLLCNNGQVKKRNLIKNNIYLGTYWQNVLSIVNESSVEANLTNNLLPLPIDQRYNSVDLKKVLKSLAVL